MRYFCLIILLCCYFNISLGDSYQIRPKLKESWQQKIIGEENQDLDVAFQVIKNDTILPFNKKINFRVISFTNSSSFILKDSVSYTNKAGIVIAKLHIPTSGNYLLEATLGKEFTHIELEVRKSHWLLQAMMTLLGGLVIFLLGMQQTAHGLRNSARNNLKKNLYFITNNRFGGFLFGILGTFLMQSSSAFSVIIISFISAGVLSFKRAVAAILGSAVGTTLTVQLISFKVGNYALLIIILGFFYQVFSKRKGRQYLSQSIIGFGFIFFGMNLMTEATEPLQMSPLFINILTSLNNSMLGAVLVSTLITALVQSSAAVIGIVISLAGLDLITLDTAILIVFGANIGTCITGLIASLGKNRDALRAATLNVFFKIGGVLLFVFFVHPFAELLTELTTDKRHQIANAHTFFNLGFSLIFLPFTSFFVKIVNAFLSDKKDKLDNNKRYLDLLLIKTPEFALEQVNKELLRMAEILATMLLELSSVIDNKLSRNKIEPYLQIKKNVNNIEDEIRLYLTELSKENLSEQEADTMSNYFILATTMETMGDIITKDLYKVIYNLSDQNTYFSKEGQRELLEFSNLVYNSLKYFIMALRKSDKSILEKVYQNQKLRIEEKEHIFALNHFGRLQKHIEYSIETSSQHMHILNALNKINSLTVKLAHTYSRILN